eukprot:gnl/TRDRNA2_/TRDRNA2_181772_c0_seq1.p1 gnl/TRDRNA2_/TRDRNA2_181772_c0~~gnl/TRDRNA2_/TRDRNA2_181772_c0_seq1.p1  ORF type:complete len:178 (+),score=51.53 gnl/TRDRNA2_/TRDRNA2_181772_c0_seq1:78-611(+)
MAMAFIPRSLACALLVAVLAVCSRNLPQAAATAHVGKGLVWRCHQLKLPKQEEKQKWLEQQPWYGRLTEACARLAARSTQAGQESTLPSPSPKDEQSARNRSLIKRRSDVAKAISAAKEPSDEAWYDVVSEDVLKQKCDWLAEAEKNGKHAWLAEEAWYEGFVKKCERLLDADTVVV